MTHVHIATAGGLTGSGFDSVKRTDTIPFHRTMLTIGNQTFESGPEVRELCVRLSAMGLPENEAKELVQQLMDKNQISFESPKDEQKTREILTKPHAL